MTFEEFMATMLQAFPDATVAEDGDGELVIHSGLRSDGDTVVPMARPR